MSQICKLKEPIRSLRFTEDMDLGELVTFVGDEGSVCINSGGVAVAFGGPYSSEDLIELDEDDVLVSIASEIEVFTSDAFDEAFKVEV